MVWSGQDALTAASVWVAGEPNFELVAYPPVLRKLAWFRGGAEVAAVRGLGRDAGKLVISLGGPHRLKAMVESGVERLPPVRLRIPRLECLRPQAQAAVAVQYSILQGELEITLPEWAKPPVQPTAVFSPVLGPGVAS